MYVLKGSFFELPVYELWHVVVYLCSRHFLCKGQQPCSKWITFQENICVLKCMATICAYFQGKFLASEILNKHPFSMQCLVKSAIYDKKYYQFGRHV